MAAAVSLLMIGALAITACGTSGGSAEAVNQSQRTSAQVQTDSTDGYKNLGTGNSSSEYIGLEAAKTAAFRHAGIDPVAYVESDFDYDRGRAIYEIDFKSEGTEYEYDIDAVTGEVVSVKRDRDDDWYARQAAAAGSGSASTAAATASVASSSGNTASGSAVSGSNSSEYIGLEKAKAAAFAHAGIDSAAYVESDFDREHGQPVYELSFGSGGIEYEYEINALTGAVQKAERDIDDDYYEHGSRA